MLDPAGAGKVAYKVTRLPPSRQHSRGSRVVSGAGWLWWGEGM